MPSKLILTLIGYFLAAAGVMGSIYAGYSHVKGIGYKEAEDKCIQKFAEYEKERDEKIANIEKLAGILVTEGRTSQAALASDITTILKNSKNKPLVIVKDGECNPSKTYSDSMSEINKRVNQDIKDSSK